MFTIYQSNRMERLVELCQRRIAEERPHKNLLTPDLALVYNAGSARWLKFQLADIEGISANLQHLLPADFVWRLFATLLPDEVPTSSHFDKQSLTWKIMHLLPGLLDRPGFETLEIYMNSEGERQLRQYQLSDRIADLFDQYLIYRPEWMIAWQQGRPPVDGPAMEEQEWQPLLWREVIEYTATLEGRTPLHRADLYVRLLQKLDALDEWPSSLPRQLSVFGISALPPQYLEILRAIAPFCDVDLFLLNPCLHYWGDIVRPSDKARLAVREIAQNYGVGESGYLMVGNPLLASMGQQGREFVDLLLEADPPVVDSYEEISAPRNMLEHIHAEILNLTHRGQLDPLDPDAIQSNEGKFEVAQNDWSLQLHGCHSRMREVEVLKDQLLHLFASDKSLTPGDVVVMMPDVTHYVPCVQSVFRTNVEESASIPYSMSDRGAHLESPLITSFLTLLSLPRSRMAAQEVIDWLAVPAVSRRFRCSDGDLSQITAWIADAGIRWGWDGESKVQWNLPPEELHTWRFGLDRMLAGYAMETEAGLYEGVLPFDQVAGSEQADLLATLLKFLDLIHDLEGELAIPRDPVSWQRLLNELIEKFYLPTDDEDLEIDMIRQCVDQLVDETRRNQFSDPLDVEVIEGYLQKHLQGTGNSQGFLSGGVTFCNLVPMRNIPFRIVCLLGMNDESYPRRSQPVGFDLITNNAARKGDRSRRNDDRYLFLEALLAARETLYISYLGKGIHDNRDRVPSVLVNELLDYCGQVFILEDDAAKGTPPIDTERHLLTWLTRDHPLQPYDRKYFDRKNDHKDTERDDTRLVSYAHDWYRARLAGEGARSSRCFVDRPLNIPAVDTEIDIQLGEFIRYFRDPAQFFFRDVLGVYFQNPEEQLQDSEPFDLNGLEKYLLAESALEAVMEDEDQDTWSERWLARGSVLPGDAGRTQLITEWDRSLELFSRLEGYLATPATRAAVDLHVAGKRITGDIDGIRGEALLFYRTGEIRANQKLEYWIKHLCLAAMGDEHVTHMISNKVPWQFASIPPETATEHLSALVGIYEYRRARPLHLIPQVSLAWQQGIEAGDPEKAMRGAMTSWNGSDYAPGASASVYNTVLYEMPRDLDDEFRETATALLGPLLGVLEKLKR